MSTKPKVLVIGEPSPAAEEIVRKEVGEHAEILYTTSSLDTLRHSADDDFDLLVVGREQLRGPVGPPTGNLLDHLPEGVVLVAPDQTILWANKLFCEWTGSTHDEIIGRPFFAPFQSEDGTEEAEILGPNFCPFHSVKTGNQPVQTTLRVNGRRQYELHVAPIFENDGTTLSHMVACLRDVTEQNKQQKKLRAIHNATMLLADIPPNQLLSMRAEERIELLKQRIAKLIKDLNYDVIEIRLLERKPDEPAEKDRPPALKGLLAIGMSPEAADRELYAACENNGITGFVAATGKSYLCEDTQADPLYLPGATEARSCVVVPLVLLNRIIGTFNVESREPRAFTQYDKECIEALSYNIAVAINTLDLLAEEEYSVAAKSVERIHGAVALPIDDMLRLTSGILNQYMELPPSETIKRVERLRQIVRHMKKLILEIGETLTPTTASPQPPPPKKEFLSGKRILVVHPNDNVRSNAHSVLEPFGCVVETANTGTDAIGMIRATNNEGGYAVIFGSRYLPDMNGIDFIERVAQEIPIEPLPFVMLIDDGYDREHIAVKARQIWHIDQFVHSSLLLTKVLDAVEQVINRPVRLRSNPAKGQQAPQPRPVLDKSSNGM
ncbi:response regulator [Thermostilla marina]